MSLDFVFLDGRGSKVSEQVQVNSGKRKRTIIKMKRLNGWKQMNVAIVQMGIQFLRDM